MICEYNVQHGVLDEGLVAQVLLQGLANVQLVVPVSNKIEAQKKERGDDTAAR